jgi:glutathione S-transferase
VTLRLHEHPYSSYCQKVRTALYELGTPFETNTLDDPDKFAAFQRLWPIAKFPVLEDTARGEIVAETSIIIEYLDLHYPGPAPLIPRDPDRALKARLWDRFFDLHIQNHQQAIIGIRLRPAGQKDPFGAAEARRRLDISYGLLEDRLGEGPWMLGEAFTIADCSAAPALRYADKVRPLDGHPKVAAYLQRLLERPSFARALEDAAPYGELMPAESEEA